MEFKWHPDEPPPVIEEHSKAKLNVLRSYLHAYCNTLNSAPNREEFKLDLVDGFSGGGTFLDQNEIISGTPLIMLEETKKAEERLNQSRNKPLKFDCKFYFVDKEKAHIDHLKKVLADHGHEIDGGKIVVSNSPFEQKVDSIIAEINRRQPRAGRAIFLLDQTGYSQVGLELVAKIFSKLANAEVILTFAVDALINYLHDSQTIIKATAPLQFTEPQIHDLIEARNSSGGRALAQRIIRPHIRGLTGAPFDTPFFIRSQTSRRALWFLHLSKHPTARDVMIQRHWDIHNTFEHYGSGSLQMLGWDAIRNPDLLTLFSFKNLDNEQMHEGLLEEMPRELHSLVSHEPMPISTIRYALANKTAAAFSDMDSVFLQLVQEGEFCILAPDGKVRSRALQRLQLTDRIALPQQIPMFSRRR